MFGAFAAGAPIGSALYAAYGFSGIVLATTLLPLATLALVAPLRRMRRHDACAHAAFSRSWRPYGFRASERR